MRNCVKTGTKLLILPILLICILVAGYLLFGEELLQGNQAPRAGNRPDTLTPDAFNTFIASARDVTAELAAEDGYTFGFPGYDGIRIPESLSRSSSDPAARYLAEKLEQSRSFGYDFSSLTGQNSTLMLLGYTKLGDPPRVYCCLSYPDGQIAGVWYDDYKAESDDILHWSDLGLREKPWDHENSVPLRMKPIIVQNMDDIP